MSSRLAAGVGLLVMGAALLAGSAVQAQERVRLMPQLGMDNITSVAISPDGRFVLTGSSDKSARLWNATTGQQIRSFDGHASSVNSVAFSPDGKSVLTEERDDSLLEEAARLWDAASGRQLRSFEPGERSRQIRGPRTDLISGASDNDPTTVASLAVIGSTTVYGLSWLVLLIIPMLAVVQAISAQVGVVMNTGLENAVRRHYGKFWALLALASVLIVNLMTLAADLEGGAAALSMLVHLDYRWFVVPLGVGSGCMLIFGNYKKIQRALIYLPLVFLSYVDH